jgi:ketosteroid isomerase-like protein
MALTTEELVRKIGNSLDQMDEEAFRAITHDDVVHHVSGKSDLAGEHKGHDGMLRNTQRMKDATGGTHKAQTLAVLSGGNYGAFVRHGTAAKDGRTFEYDYVVLVRLENGKIAETWNFVHDQHEHDAAFSS